MGAGAGTEVARTSWRLRSRALVTVALLLAVVGGVAMAGVAASRRGDSAPARLNEAYRAPGVSLFTSAFGDRIGAARVELLQSILDDAGVGGAEITAGAALISVAEAPEFAPFMLSDIDITPGPFRQPFLVEGRYPVAADEVAVNESSTQRFGVDIGGSIDISWFPAADLETLGGGRLTEPAGTRSMRVTGIIRFPADLLEDARAEEGTLFVGNAQAGLFASSFWDDVGGDIAAYQVAAVLDPTPEEFDALLAAADGTGVFVQQGEGTDDDSQRGVRNAVHLESVALLAFALVLAAGVVVFLGVAIARTASPRDADRRTLVGLGVVGSDLLTGAAIVGGVVGLVGGAGATVVAIGLSHWAPVGFARRAEVDPGIDVDLTVLLPGALLFVVLATIAAVLGARRGHGGAGDRAVGRAPVRAPSFPSMAAGVGTQFLAASTRGRNGGSMRAGLGLSVLGVVVVVAAGSFAATLTHLTSTPIEQGWNWDLAVGNYSDPATSVEAADVLAADPDIEAYAGFNSDVVVIDGEELVGAGFEAGVEPVVVDGRAPSALDEVALGRATADSLGRAIGDEVEITNTQTGEALSFRVVGVVVPPAPLGEGMSLDEGAVFTFDGFSVAAFGGTEGTTAPFVHLVRVRPGADLAAVADRLREAFPGTVNTRAVTSDIRSLLRVQGLPFGLALALGGLGLGATALVLDALARRRRRDLAMLRSIGFTHREIVTVVLWQAALVAVGALAVGLPLGLAAGSRLWSVAADRIGTDLPSIIPTRQLLVAVPAVVVAAIVLAALPALAAARRPPVLDLRPD